MKCGAGRVSPEQPHSLLGISGTLDHYTRLADEARRDRAELPADHLVPGDAVTIEGHGLIVTDTHVLDRLVVLDFEGLDFALTVPRDKPIRVVHAIGPAAVAALDATIASEQALDALLRRR
jgi:hypothetical protein